MSHWNNPLFTRGRTTGYYILFLNRVTPPPFSSRFALPLPSPTPGDGTSQSGFHSSFVHTPTSDTYSNVRPTAEARRGLIVDWIMLVYFR